MLYGVKSWKPCSVWCNRKTIKLAFFRKFLKDEGFIFSTLWAIIWPIIQNDSELNSTIFRSFFENLEKNRLYSLRKFLFQKSCFLGKLWREGQFENSANVVNQAFICPLKFYWEVQAFRHFFPHILLPILENIYKRFP